MVMSIYLHKYVMDTLKSFGDPNVVVDKVLEYMDNKMGLTDYPECPDRRKCSRYNVDVNYKPYLEVYNRYGFTSPRVSIRKILYNFVDNEMYLEDDWLQYNSIVYSNNDDHKYMVNKCEDITRLLNRIYERCTLSEKQDIIKLMSDVEQFKLKILREDINNETQEHTGETFS